jgi:hypothetical protein
MQGNLIIPALADEVRVGELLLEAALQGPDSAARARRRARRPGGRGRTPGPATRHRADARGAGRPGVHRARLDARLRFTSFMQRPWFG